MRYICASRMAACHSILFTLESGNSGIYFYITQREAALPNLSVDKYEKIICMYIALILIWNPYKCNSLPVI